MQTLYDIVKPMADNDGLRVHGWSPETDKDGEEIVLLSDDVGTVGIVIRGCGEIKNNPRYESSFLDLVETRYSYARKTLADNR